MLYLLGTPEILLLKLFVFFKFILEDFSGVTLPIVLSHPDLCLSSCHAQSKNKKSLF